MNSYELSRRFFDFCFLNPEKIKPNHIAVYFFAIETCNRLGWKDKFGFPTSMAMEATGIKSYNTYVNALIDLVEFGFIKMIEKSKNQHSANIIALSNFNKAHDKALDKAIEKHITKQRESTCESKCSIDKQVTIEQINNKQYVYNSFYDNEIKNSNNDENYLGFVKILFAENDTGEDLKNCLSIKKQVTYQGFAKVMEARKTSRRTLKDVLQSLENYKDCKKYSNLQLTLINWLKNSK